MNEETMTRVGSQSHSKEEEYNSNKMHKSHNLFYLTTALHVSGVTITHLQEHKTNVTTAFGNRYIVLLPVAYATHNTLKPVPNLPR
jgi:hypothetical protein